MHSPEEQWKVFDKDAPYDAGNIDPQVIKEKQVEAMHDIPHFALYEYPKGSNENGTFFITSFCETVFLRDEMQTFNAYGCKLPPDGD